MKLAARFFSLTLPLLTVLAIFCVETQARGWFLSGDTSISCMNCPAPERGLGTDSLLRLKDTDHPFFGIVGGGLSVGEQTRFDFMPHITIAPITTLTAAPGAALSHAHPHDLSANRGRSDILRFTDGRGQIKGAVSMPEPATLLLLGSGVTGLIAACWKRRKMSSSE